MPLVLERKPEQEIILELMDFPDLPPIRIKTLEATKGSTRSLVDAPQCVRIWRGEVFDQEQANKVLPMVNPRGTPAPDHRKQKRA